MILLWIISSIYLFSKKSGRHDFDRLQKIMISGEVWLVNEHTSVEVQRRLRTKLRLWPCHLVRTLLAITDLVLWRVAPCLFTETVHDCVELTIREIKQVIYVVEHLYVAVQVYHFVVLHKLQPYIEILLYRDIKLKENKILAQEK